MRLYEALTKAIEYKAIIYIESRGITDALRKKQIRAVKNEWQFYKFEQRLEFDNKFADWDNTPMTLSLKEIDADDWAIANDETEVKREEIEKEKKELKSKLFDFKKALEHFEKWID